MFSQNARPFVRLGKPKLKIPYFQLSVLNFCICNFSTTKLTIYANNNIVAVFNVKLSQKIAAMNSDLANLSTIASLGKFVGLTNAMTLTNINGFGSGDSKS